MKRCLQSVSLLGTDHGLNNDLKQAVKRLIFVLWVFFSILAASLWCFCYRGLLGLRSIKPRSARLFVRLFDKTSGTHPPAQNNHPLSTPNGLLDQVALSTYVA